MEITNIITLLLMIAISSIKLGQGFDFDLKTIFTTESKPIIIKGIIVSVFFVPLLFISIILIFKPSVQVSAALIIMAVCPAADLSIQHVKQLGGNVRLAAGIQAISALMTIVTIPIFIKLFESILGEDFQINLLSLTREVAVAQFIPMIVGMLALKFFSRYSWIAPYLMKISRIILLICFVILIIINIDYFAVFKWQSYVMIAFATACAFLLGVIFAGKNKQTQISLAIESSFRNPGLAFLIAAENFSQERVHMAILPYVVTLTGVIVTCTVLLKFFQRFSVISHDDNNKIQ